MTTSNRSRDDYDYPKLLEVECAICGEKITLIIELVIGTPEPIGGIMRVPFDPEPTILAGCHHFYDGGRDV